MIAICTKIGCGRPFDRGITNMNSTCPHCGTSSVFGSPSPEVADVLVRLKAWLPNDVSEDQQCPWECSDAVLIGGLRTLCKDAINLITLLSAKKVVRGTINGGVLDLEEVSEGVEVDIRDYDTDGMDEENLEEDESGTHFQAG